MRPSSHPARAVAATGLLVLAAGCGREARNGAPSAAQAGAHLLLVSQVPRGQGGSLPVPGVRLPEGSRLVSYDLQRPDSPPRLLSEGLVAAGLASLDHGAARLAFVGKQKPEDPYAVWTQALDGSGRRKVSPDGQSCGGAAFLPDGRIVYAAATEGEPPLAGLGSGWALFVAGGEPPAVRRITFTGGADLDPSVLSDGRILFASFAPEAGPEGTGGLGLFTVHPDGTGFLPFAGVHGGPAFKLLPRQAPQGDVVYVGREAGSDPAGRPWLAEWSSPLRRSRTLDLPPGDVRSIEPGADGALLVAVASGGGGASGGAPLRLHPGGGAAGPALPPDPAFEVAQALEVRARPRPQGHLSMVDASKPHGSLLCVDARDGAGVAATAVRLSTVVGPGAGGGRLVLGEVPLKADGSFFVQVPADRPLVLDLVGEAGQVVLTTRSTFWVRPGEVRACVGCHEDPETAPPNRRPLAVLEEPVDLSKPHGKALGVAHGDLVGLARKTRQVAP